MKNKDMIVELMSLLKLAFEPEDMIDKYTGEKLMYRHEVRREAMLELKNDYLNYKSNNGVFKNYN
jgi:hypothetical protein